MAARAVLARSEQVHAHVRAREVVVRELVERRLVAARRRGWWPWRRRAAPGPDGVGAPGVVQGLAEGRHASASSRIASATGAGSSSRAPRTRRGRARGRCGPPGRSAPRRRRRGRRCRASRRRGGASARSRGRPRAPPRGRPRARRVARPQQPRLGVLDVARLERRGDVLRAPRRARPAPVGGRRTIRRVGGQHERADGQRRRPPPTSVDEARAREAVAGGCSVATSAAETAACWAKIWPEPSTQRRTSRATTSASCPSPGAERITRVGDRDPERDAQDHLDRAPAALALREPERDDRGDRSEERRACPTTSVANSLGDDRGQRRLEERRRVAEPLGPRARRDARAFGRLLEQGVPRSESRGRLGHDAMLARSGARRRSHPRLER